MRAVSRVSSRVPRNRVIPALLAAVVFVSGFGLGQSIRPARSADPDFELVHEAWGLVLTHYVDAGNLDPTFLAYRAIDAPADATGDSGHTAFYPAEDLGYLPGPAPLLPQVSWNFLPGSQNVLLALTDFEAGAADAVRSALSQAEAGGARGLILDLRGNPGGLVDEAVAVASEFIASGTVVRLRYPDGSEEAVPVLEGARATSLPMVVLVDADTASAAEVVASALQDAGRAPVVGTSTFGTGTALHAYPLTDGSEMYIGYAQWLSRDGRSVWHVGIVPDVSQTRPVGLEPTRPSDLRYMTVSSLATLPDRQLVAAISVLEELT